MSNITTDQMVFLDSLFTQKDFHFLNSLEQEIDLIQNQIKKQENMRDIIVEAIKHFESTLKELSKDNISPISNLLEEIEKAFKLVNFNIKSLYNLKQFLSSINTGIVDLLVTIESNPSAKQSHVLQADSLKSSIAEYSNCCNDIKTQISNNDLILNQFLSSDSFKSIFSNIKQDSTISNIYKFIPIDDKKNETEKEESKSININDDTYSSFNNNVLRVSEKENKVYLPYANTEIKSYLVQFPSDYHSAEDVIKNEFILPLGYFMKHPVLSRFRETYSLIRDREAKPIIDAIKYSMNLMFSYELNPTIIAACKTQEQLENYLNCLSNNTLDQFKDFEIKFEISPI